MDVALAQACAQERPQCRCVLEVCDQSLAETFKVLIRLVDGATLTCVARHARDDVGELLHHRACQHVRHALVLVAYLAPDLHSWDPPRLSDPPVVGVINCTSKNFRDLIVLQDAVQFGTCGCLLCRMLKNSIVKDPHLHSVCLSEVLEVDGLVRLLQRRCIFEPQLGVVAEI